LVAASEPHAMKFRDGETTEVRLEVSRVNP
jgi:hypothetical protein